MPPTPIMGGVIPAPREGNVAWTGGLPKPDWTGLVNPMANVSPNQHRSFSGQKALAIRRTGLPNKWKTKGDLVDFCTSISKRLKDTGLDSIAHLPDPVDPTKMISVIDHYARFTTTYAREQHAILRSKFDMYDLQNDDTATDIMLLDSVYNDLRITLSRKIMDETGFVEVWLAFMEEIKSKSTDYYDRVRATITHQQPTMFPGQNITLMSRVFRDAADELTKAGEFRHTDTLHMIKGFRMANGPDIFRHKLLDFQSKIKDALQVIQFMDPVAAQCYMDQAHLNYKDICLKAENMYNTAVNDLEWTPAKSAIDSKAAPAFILQNNMAASQSSTS
jgi:hypothetical protein